MVLSFNIKKKHKKPISISIPYAFRQENLTIYMDYNDHCSITLASKDRITAGVLAQGITTWGELLQRVRNLPYGRSANRTDYSHILEENKGTCSSKHAFLRQIADLNGISNVQLILCMYKMSQSNTPRIGNEMTKNGLDYLPEAHCYLNIDGIRSDFTNPHSSFDRIKMDVLEEIEITPDQVIEYKVAYHQHYLKQWIESKKIPFTFEQVWAIREQCIKNLSA